MKFEEQIHKQQQAFDESQQSNDADATAKLLTNNFRLVGPAGFTLDKEQTLSRFKPNGLHYTAFTTSELVIEKYGDTAVVWGVSNQEGTFQGMSIDAHFRVTEVWVNEGNNTWRLAAWHASPLGPPPAFLRQQQKDS